jgi:hypothetical protein
MIIKNCTATGLLSEFFNIKRMRNIKKLKNQSVYKLHYILTVPRDPFKQNSSYCDNDYPNQKTN